MPRRARHAGRRAHADRAEPGAAARAARTARARRGSRAAALRVLVAARRGGGDRRRRSSRSAARRARSRPSHAGGDRRGRHAQRRRRATTRTATDGEHDADAPKATDGNPATYWDTEHYRERGFGRPEDGVGLVLDAGRAVEAQERHGARRDTPGFTAEILAGSSPAGPFAPDSPSQTVGRATTFTLDGATARYYVVWITEPRPEQRRRT